VSSRPWAEASPPELVDELVGRADLVRMEEENPEKRTLLMTAEL